MARAWGHEIIKESLRVPHLYNLWFDLALEIPPKIFVLMRVSTSEFHSFAEL